MTRRRMTDEQNPDQSSRRHSRAHSIIPGSIRESVSDHLQSLRRTFRRSHSASIDTTTSGTPSTLDRRERRRRAQATGETFSDSDVSTPLLNSQTTGHNADNSSPNRGAADALAIAGMLIATSEVNMLSTATESTGNRSKIPRRAGAQSSASSTAVMPPNTPSSDATRSIVSSSAVTPSLSIPSSGAALTGVPSNTPLSGLGSAAGNTIGAGQRLRGRYRRTGGRSRLSEVCTPADIPEEAEPRSEETSPDTSATNLMDNLALVKSSAEARHCQSSLFATQPLWLSQLPREPTVKGDLEIQQLLDETSNAPTDSAAAEMTLLKDLIDLAIQRTSDPPSRQSRSPSPNHPAGAHYFDPSTLDAPVASQVKLRDHTVCGPEPETEKRALPMRPHLVTSASSPGPSGLPLRSLPLLPERPDRLDFSDGKQPHSVHIQERLDAREAQDLPAGAEEAALARPPERPSRLVRRSTSGTVEVSQSAGHGDGQSTPSGSSEGSSADPHDAGARVSQELGWWVNLI